MSDLDTPLIPWQVPKTGIYNVTPKITVLPKEKNTLHREITVTAKKRDELKGKSLITITDGIVNAEEFSIEVEKDDELFFEFSTRDSQLQGKLKEYSIEVNGIEVPMEFHSAAIEKIIGDPYRGWSVFGYDGNRERAVSPIEITEEDLTLEEYFDKDVREEMQQQIEDGTFDPKDMQLKVYPFYPEMAKKRLRSADEDAWATGEILSSSRYGLNYIDVPRPFDFAGARAVARLSRTSQRAISGGVGDSA